MRGVPGGSEVARLPFHDDCEECPADGTNLTLFVNTGWIRRYHRWMLTSLPALDSVFFCPYMFWRELLIAVSIT
jgi:hypothetical protein